jgi:hypothetical protein
MKGVKIGKVCSLHGREMCSKYSHTLRKRTLERHRHGWNFELGIGGLELIHMIQCLTVVNTVMNRRLA